MQESVDVRDDPAVLQSKGDASRYQILIQIAERQPTISQREIAERVGMSSQAVSDYLQELTERGFVQKHGRLQYEVTKRGVDWLISQTDTLQQFVDHVSSDVLEKVDVDTAITRDDVREGERVALTMEDGLLHASSNASATTTAIAVTDAEPGQEVGVTDFEGMLDHELGTVTVLPVPPVRDGGSAAVDADAVTSLAATVDVVATSGVEAVVAARNADVTPDARYGTPAAVRDAATRGQDVLLLAVDDVVEHTERLRDGDVAYEVVDSTEEEK